jgi:hypothetical protein
MFETSKLQSFFFLYNNGLTVDMLRRYWSTEYWTLQYSCALYAVPDAVMEDNYKYKYLVLPVQVQV